MSEAQHREHTSPRFRRQIHLASKEFGGNWGKGRGDVEKPHYNQKSSHRQSRDRNFGTVKVRAEKASLLQRSRGYKGGVDTQGENRKGQASQSLPNLGRRGGLLWKEGRRRKSQEMELSIAYRSGEIQIKPLR